MPSSISVIIPACDAAAYLPRCLQALGNSACEPFETIVVDDGSKDSTADLARRFGARVLTTDRRSGPARARNLGAKEATGDIVFFLDADVCVKVDTLFKIAHSFNSDPELDALMGSYDSDPSCPD